jgi:hypothetical protein
VPVVSCTDSGVMVRAGSGAVCWEGSPAAMGLGEAGRATRSERAAAADAADSVWAGSIAAAAVSRVVVDD